jgi:uroporphyrin-3 C-methyltransferase
MNDPVVAPTLEAERGSEGISQVRGRRDWSVVVALLCAVLALLLAGITAWWSQTRTHDMELQLARRIGEFDASSREARSAASAVRATSEDMLARIAALEAKAQDAQNQQLALSAMYQELARSQDDRLIADIEQGLLLAQQQLQLAGNTRAAIVGLEALEARLAGLRKPQFTRLREAVAADTAQLRLLPAADIIGINARLDAMIESVDALTLEGDADPNVKKPAVAPVESDWLSRWRADAWAELKSLIRIRRMDHPDLPLLAPSQAYFLRQNLKLRLLAARLSLLQRDEASFRGDLVAADRWLATYFNEHDPICASMRENLGGLAKLPVAQQALEIRASLKALKTLRGERP